jgi:hypothetical protein
VDLIQAAAVACAKEIARLRSENAAMREALEQIRSCAGSVHDERGLMGRLADAALSPSAAEDWEARIRKDERSKTAEALEAAKATTFSDAKTYRTSGPEYQKSAENQERGWDKAVEFVRSLK